MIKCKILDKRATSVGDLEIAKIDPGLNMPLIAQAARCEMSKVLKKSGKAKTRSEVRGGGRKPWRQKGTGRARAGTIRSPLFRGGGITFGPTGKNRTLRIPRKMRALAIYQLLIWKAKSQGLVILNDLKLDDLKTKSANDLISKIIPNCEVLVLYTESELADMVPYVNLAQVKTRPLSNLLIRDLIKNSKILISKSSAEKLFAARSVRSDGAKSKVAGDEKQTNERKG
jgi:large subunit ribosomal protein L4